MCDRFQVLFHSPPGVLFTFPSRYLSAIGHQGVFRLSRWSCQIHAKFHEFRTTWEHTQKDTHIHIRDSNPLRSSIQTDSTSRMFFNFPTTRQHGNGHVPQPPNRNACRLSHDQGLASSTFARHYSRNHYCFLFLWVLRCFTSPRSLQLPYIFKQRSPDITLEI